MGKAVSTTEYPAQGSCQRRLVEEAQSREHRNTTARNTSYDTSKSVFVTDENGSEYLVPIDTITPHRVVKEEIEDNNNRVYEHNADQSQTISLRQIKRLKLDSRTDSNNKSIQLQSRGILAEGSLDHTGSLNKEEDICMKEPSD